MTVITNIWTLFLSLLIFLASCSKSNNKLDCPREILENRELIEYFNLLDEVINEYVTMVEGIIDVSKNKKATSSEEGLSQAMGMFSEVMSTAIKIEPVLKKMEQLESRSDILKSKLSEKELKPFLQTYAKMSLRISQISKKINY